MKKLLGSDIADASKLVKASAHPARLKVLSLLAEGPVEFAALQDGVGLSKTALANHLNQMVRMGLVERHGRGSYRLSEDGAQLLGAISGFYAGSKARARDSSERMAEQYSRSYGGRKMNGEKLVSMDVRYQPCWLSYTGAVAGALTAMGKKVDVTDVGGYTGYAFILNVFKGPPCPSGPTALKEGFAEIHKGTERLGFKLRFMGDEKSFTKQGAPLKPEDYERARRLFEQVKKEIDADRPVVLWGLVVPEYGIVKGYKGDSYLVSTFRSHLVSTYKDVISQNEDPIRFDELDAPGCLEAIGFGKESTPMTEKDDRDALARAIRMASGEAETFKGYANGPEAYEEWAKGLEASPKGPRVYHGNSYVGACYHEGRSVASAFLGRLAKRYAGKPQAEHLKKASAEYAKAAERLSAFEKLFPFAPQGEMPADKCHKGAALLRGARPCEEAAIAHMRKAHEEWK